MLRNRSVLRRGSGALVLAALGLAIACVRTDPLSHEEVERVTPAKHYEPEPAAAVQPVPSARYHTRLARLGYVDWELQGERGTIFGGYEVAGEGGDLFWGIGVDFALLRKRGLALRAEFESYTLGESKAVGSLGFNLGKSEANVGSLGLKYRF